MAGSSINSPLPAGEVELSLFGPGYGESVLVGTCGDWIIVDSCLNEKGEPAATAYLRGLGVDPKTAVKFVIATHWHDDHVRGLADVVSECASAQFLCSAALRRDEFVQLTQIKDDSGIRAAAPMASAITSGVQEFANILHVLETRANLAQSNSTPSLVAADRRIWQRIGSEGVVPAELWSLSPSDESLFKAYQDLSSLLSEAKESPSSFRVRSPSPNHAAVALWLIVGSDQMLLGSDLEEKRGANGWSAILSSKGRPNGKANLFKVAHHGSQNAHHDVVWSSMLERPVSLLTRFERGAVSLPTDADIVRVRALSSDAYATSQGQAARRKRSSTVEKTIKETVARIRPARPPMGQIRMRSVGGGWRSELFGAATRL